MTLWEQRGDRSLVYFIYSQCAWRWKRQVLPKRRSSLKKFCAPHLRTRGNFMATTNVGSTWYHVFTVFSYTLVGRVAKSVSVGIATGYELDGPGIESRWRARFSAPVQTGPWTHPASCTMGTGSFPGVEFGRGVTLTPHPLLVPRSKNRLEVYLYFPGRSGDRIHVGARFFAQVQTGPGTHLAFCTMGTVSFPGGKAAGSWCWPPTPS
jgi:hypothetical protein